LKPGFPVVKERRGLRQQRSPDGSVTAPGHVGDALPTSGSAMGNEPKSS
jgi:hypothetical protein